MTEGFLETLENLGRGSGPPGHDLVAALRSLEGNLRVAVPSLRGLAVTLVVEGQPVELVSVPATTTSAEIRSSLQISLAPVLPNAVDGRLTLWAGETDAFAETEALLRSTHDLQHVRVRTDLVGQRELTSRLTGLDELATINRALGVLIGQGHDLAGARAELRDRAATAHLAVAGAAAEVLEAVRRSRP